jgi:hypothetical protein
MTEADSKPDSDPAEASVGDGQDAAAAGSDALSKLNLGTEFELDEEDLAMISALGLC